MKLSIITINLNNINGLKRTIDSVISQTYHDFEWIMIDGGSMDGSKELIEKYANHFAYWVSEKDGGIYNAMNKGVKHSSGEYLQFLNSGDELADSKVLDEIISQLYSDDIIYGDMINYVFDGNEKKMEMKRYPQQFAFHTLMRGSIGHCASFIKRQLLVDTPYNESYRIVSDWEFFIKMALSCHSFRHINRFISLFDLSGISATNPQLLISEGQDVCSRLIPECLYADYENGNLGQFMVLRERHPFARKMVSMIIKITAKIDTFN